MGHNPNPNAGNALPIVQPGQRPPAGLPSPANRPNVYQNPYSTPIQPYNPNTRNAPGGLNGELIFEVQGSEVILENLLFGFRALGHTVPKNIYTKFGYGIQNYVYDPLQRELDAMVTGGQKWGAGGIVPEDTGRLRAEIMRSYRHPISMINSTLNPFQVFIGAHSVEYAARVAGMTTSMVAHPGTHGPTKSYRQSRYTYQAQHVNARVPHVFVGPRGGVWHWKNDPMAQGSWWWDLVGNGRQIAEDLMNRFIGNHINPIFTNFGLNPMQVDQYVRSFLFWRYS